MAERGDSGPIVRPAMRTPAKLPGARASRSIARLLEATKEVFLDRGYAGTTVDEIARVAGMSRASFYTYFPTKRDALLALGLRAIKNDTALDRATAAELSAATAESVLRWVEARWAQLDHYAGFSIAWTQAARHDDELRVAGMREHLRLCRFIGVTLGEADAPRAEALGLVILGMIERSWSFCSLYGEAVDQASVRAEIVQAILGMVRSMDRVESELA